MEKNKDLDLFKKQLEKLLLKFPELPEFTLTIRPRVSITTPSINHPKMIYLPVENPATGEKVEALASSLGLKRKDDPNIPQSLESGITKSRIDSLKASVEIE